MKSRLNGAWATEYRSTETGVGHKTKVGFLQLQVEVEFHTVNLS